MSKLLLLGFLLPLLSFGQTTGMVWTEVGVKGTVAKKFDLGLTLTGRFDAIAAQTWFPQATIKYKVTKWFKPSVEYRLISKRSDNGNYALTSRLNFNAEFKKTLSRFEGGLRVRYQYSFGKLFASSSYDPEFDVAIRIKPQISYDINNSIFTPTASIELFFDPTVGPYGQRLNKTRTFVGVKLDWDSPHDISVGYMYDTKVNLPNPNNKHILSIAYSYNIGFKKKKN